MFEADAVRDAAFLHKLDRDPNRVMSVRVLVLNAREDVLANLEGRIISGNITVNGNSAMRRTGNITFVASEEFNDIANIDNVLTVDKRVKIYIGLENHVENYVVKEGIKCDKGEMVWINMGVYLMSQPNISHDINSVKVSLQLRDKMCLLNGECGGTLPASIQLDSYEQMMSIRHVDALPEPERANPFIYYEITRDKLYWTWRALNAYTYKDAEGRDITNDYKGTLESDKSTGTTWQIIHDATKNDMVYFRYDTETGWEMMETRPAVDTESDESYCLVKQRMRDMIYTLVANFGGIDIAKVVVNDVPMQIPQIVSYIGSDDLWYKPSTGEYTFAIPGPNETIINGDLEVDEDIKDKPAPANGWIKYQYGAEIGKMFTDLTYPGSLVTSFGDTITTALDKIKSALGNYEYFFDVNGNFVFQEVKNYLNNQYDPVTRYSIADSDAILTNDNVTVDFSNSSYNIYTFEDNNEMINSYAKTENYQNIKNDFHIWGKSNSGSPIHYHLAIKDKPKVVEHYVNPVTGEKEGLFKIVVMQDIYFENGQYIVKPTGKIRLATEDDIKRAANEKEQGKKPVDSAKKQEDVVIVTRIEDYEIKQEEWREVLYMSGLVKISLNQRPDVHEQELLDYFDSIYDMYNHKYKNTDFDRTDLPYWIDYLEPIGKLAPYSIDVIGIRTTTNQSDDVKRLFEADVPDRILINNDWNIYKQTEVKKYASRAGKPISVIDGLLYDNIVFSQSAGTAMTYVRELMYEGLPGNDTINFSGVPIYYLEPNRRITVSDFASGIDGDYVINNISLPLDNKGQMSISANKALTRI